MALDYAKAYQQFIDEELAAASATAWMIPEAGKVRFSGGKTVEISTLTTTGLGTYQSGKTDGSAFPSGTVTNTWNSYSLAMDRGVKFSLDRMDPATPPSWSPPRTSSGSLPQRPGEGAGHVPHPQAL